MIWSVPALTSQFLVMRFGGNLKCNFGKMYFYSRINFINDFFFYCLLLYSIFSISFSQEEQIQDFLHLLRISPLKESTLDSIGHDLWKSIT